MWSTDVLTYRVLESSRVLRDPRIVSPMYRTAHALLSWCMQLYYKTETISGRPFMHPFDPPCTVAVVSISLLVFQRSLTARSVEEQYRYTKKMY